MPIRRPEPSSRGRTPLRDNTRLLAIGGGLLLAALAGLLTIANRSAAIAPDFLTEFVLYALTVTNVTMLLVLAVVLARNIVKLVVERRRALVFARFRAKLVAVLLGMTLIPAVLVLLVGSELIRNSVDRWFNAPMDEVLGAANAIAGDYYQERQALVSTAATQMARALLAVDLAAARPENVRDLVAPDVLSGRVRLVEVYRTLAGGRGVVPVVDVAAPSLARGYSRASADRLAERVAAGEGDVRVIERVSDGGELIRTAVPIRMSDSGPVLGVVVASEHLNGQLAERARQMAGAYEDYQQLVVLKQPLTTVYLSFFLMLTLLILVAATWMGLYLAKRITRPVQMLAAAAKEIGAGHLDQRLVPETADEFGSLVEAFNSMAGELAVGRRKLERTTLDVERKHQDGEARRRYIETILDRIATGVVSIDRGGGVGTINPAAARLLGLVPNASGLPVTAVFGGAEHKTLVALINDALRSRVELPPQELSIVRDGRELHLAVMATPLQRGDGVSEGVVLVFDDVTPFVRAQKVAAWREVARRLAHEIKNPLTPIRLCAERIQRQFSDTGEATRAIVDECTSTIVGEVESLKGLVDEFSQFARMPPPRVVPTDVHRLLLDALSLYQGIFADVEIRTHFASSLPIVSADPGQIRRVVINVVDNAIEAMEEQGTIEVETRHDETRRVIQIVVMDCGPGIPPAEREKLFFPHYSTKQRGSGLGLAIVRRIVDDHGGRIDISTNSPTGTRFAIELPA